MTRVEAVRRVFEAALAWADATSGVQLVLAASELKAAVKALRDVK